MKTRQTKSSRCLHPFCSGFSILEMFVVIVVICIIGAIAIPNMPNMHDEANKRQEASRRYQIEIIKDAMRELAKEQAEKP